jgi:hypothetical protein
LEERPHAHRLDRRDRSGGPLIRTNLADQREAQAAIDAALIGRLRAAGGKSVPDVIRNSEEIWKSVPDVITREICAGRHHE